ncbi:MAG TPA: CopD family protein, partial [Longimicrobiales bacterium]
MILTLLQEGEHGFELGEAARQFAQFIAWFGIFGPLGFRYVVMRGSAGPEPDRELAAVDEIWSGALRRAALIGLGGALLLIADLLPLTTRNTVNLVCAAVLALAYAIARRRPLAWHLALLAGLVLVFQSIVRLRWQTLVNPVHMTSAAVWIGTLFVVVSAGIPAILRAPLRERRGPLVAELIARFSPLALFGAGFLVLTGLITAWRHLGSIAALWSTSYGITLIVKLCFVGVVVALGAWNWKQLSPRLGTEETASAIRRSATAEVGTTLLVL